MMLTAAQIKSLRGLVGSDTREVRVEQGFGGGVRVVRGERSWMIDVNGNAVRLLPFRGEVVA